MDIIIYCLFFFFFLRNKFDYITEMNHQIINRFHAYLCYILFTFSLESMNIKLVQPSFNIRIDNMCN